MMIQWVNDDRTVLVRGWLEGAAHARAPREAFPRLEVCTRPHDGAIWGPPETLQIEPALDYTLRQAFPVISALIDEKAAPSGSTQEEAA